MKKLTLMTLSFLINSLAIALPVGNPSEASLVTDGFLWEGHYSNPCDPCSSWCDAWSIRTGFYGDYVFNRHMELEGKGNPKVENYQVFSNSAIIVVNFWDRVDLFTTLGATHIFMSSNPSSFDPDATGTAQPFEIEGSTDFSWSVGIRSTIWECGCTSLGGEAQYFATKSQITRMSAGDDAVYPDDQLNLKQYDWQIGLGVAHRINMLIPYAAVKWAHARTNFDDIKNIRVGTVDIVELKQLEQSKKWGYALGVSFVDCEKACITVEGRFADEKAVHVNGQIRF